MPQLGEPPMPSGITMQERGVRWHRLGITTQGLGDEFTAESYADRLRTPTHRAEQEQTRKRIQQMLTMLTIQRTYQPMELGKGQAFQLLREPQRLFSVRGKRPSIPTTL